MDLLFLASFQLRLVDELAVETADSGAIERISRHAISRDHCWACMLCSSGVGAVIYLQLKDARHVLVKRYPLLLSRDKCLPCE